jgi:hypothetical protein
MASTMNDPMLLSFTMGVVLTQYFFSHPMWNTPGEVRRRLLRRRELDDSDFQIAQLILQLVTFAFARPAREITLRVSDGLLIPITTRFKDNLHMYALHGIWFLFIGYYTRYFLRMVVPPGENRQWQWRDLFRGIV